jgi:hypothetical protein
MQMDMAVSASVLSVSISVIHAGMTNVCVFLPWREHKLRSLSSTQDPWCAGLQPSEKFLTQTLKQRGSLSVLRQPSHAVSSVAIVSPRMM